MGFHKQQQIKDFEDEQAHIEALGHKCARCEEPYDPEQVEGDLCDYCQHVWDKMDD